MKNKLNIPSKSYQHHFICLTVAVLLVFLMLPGCGSDKNIGRVEFLCMDQTGTPLEKVAVTFNNKEQQTNDQGLCQFRVKLDSPNLPLPVAAQKTDYQFIGPGDVYLKPGQVMKYGLNLLSNRVPPPDDHTDSLAKLTFEFIYPKEVPSAFVLEIESDPTGSKVTISRDQTTYAQDKIAPFTITLAPGNYDIHAVNESGYRDVEEIINVASDSTIIIKHDKRIEIQYATLQVESVPTGSEITINDRRGRVVARGRTGYNKTLPQGTYKVHAVSALGYLAEDVEVNLTSNKTITIEHRIIPIKIKIVTVPEEAYVYLNGRKEYGATPLEIRLKQAGFHNLEIQKTGFETHKKKIEFRAGAKDTTLSVTLNGLPHNFTIRLKERGKVFIDGNLINTEWQERIEVKGMTAGYHKIEIWYQKGNRKETYPKYLIKGTNDWVYDDF